MIKQQYTLAKPEFDSAKKENVFLMVALCILIDHYLDDSVTNPDDFWFNQQCIKCLTRNYLSCMKMMQVLNDYIQKSKIKIQV